MSKERLITLFLSRCQEVPQRWKLLGSARGSTAPQSLARGLIALQATEGDSGWHQIWRTGVWTWICKLFASQSVPYQLTISTYKILQVVSLREMMWDKALLANECMLETSMHTCTVCCPCCDKTGGRSWDNSPSPVLNSFPMSSNPHVLLSSS